MSVNPSGNPSAKRKTKSNLLRRPSFSPLSRGQDEDQDRQPTRLLQKKRPSLMPLGLTKTDKAGGILVEDVEKEYGSESPQSNRPSMLRRGRPASLFGSLRSFRMGDEETPPDTATSSKAPSVNWKDFGSGTEDTGIGKNRIVLHHGEAQTNAGLFWKRREYLVLTETHLVRFKSRAKAAETFPSISSSSRQSGGARHASSPSTASRHETNSATSEASGDAAANIPLQKVVAVYLSDDARHLPTVEVSFLDPDVGQGATLTLQLTDREDIEVWMKSIRMASDRARLLDMDPIPPKLSEYAARVVEREQDYDITNYRIYKVVKRGNATRTVNRSSADDFSKAGATVCFLVVGLRSVHLIMLPKSPLRVSNTSLTDMNDGGSFGIMSLTSIIVSDIDDRFSITFRSPFQKPHNFQLASLAATEISLRIRQVEHYLRPGWAQRPYHFRLPAGFDDDSFLDQPQDDELNPFDRTMVAYCTAYGINSRNIRYGIFDEDCEDPPRFELFEPASGGARGYSALELLAVMRSLRYNESYTTFMFGGISLDILNEAYDRYGAEHVCTQSMHGLPVKLPIEEQQEAPLLVQEVRALAIASRRLRRLDFSYCIANSVSKASYDGRTIPGSCGIIEALFPLCKQQATNVDWIALNGIVLQETDLDYLVSIAVEKAAHFRAIEAGKCGLTDRGLALLLDVFTAHENTLEALDISNNTLRLVPAVISRQLNAFNCIRVLDMSNLALSTTNEALIPVEILSQWRLEELRLRGVPLAGPSIAAICEYLARPQSQPLRQMNLSNCSLTGADAATMMQCMSQNATSARFLHLDISENSLQDRMDNMATAIAKNWAPSHLTMKSIEYDLEDLFENLLLAFATNRTVILLDLSMTSLPAEAGEGVCKALEKLLAENDTIKHLDISGENSRLEVSKLGVGINQALNGLKYNTSLETLHVQNQKLGLQGASTLADVLKENKQLRQLHCDYNAISLSGFTDLVNALAHNTSLLYLPTLEEGRDAALRQTEEQIKLARVKEVTSTMSSTNSKLSSMRRTLATFGAGPADARNGGRVAAVPEWTEQDIQAALRLVSEGWEGQKARLNAYLERNWHLYKGLPLEENTDDAEQRPGTAGSLSKIMDKVALESTPTIEKELQLGDLSIASDGQYEEKQMEGGTIGDVGADYAHFMKENEVAFHLEQPPLGNTTKDDFAGRARRSTNDTDETAHE